MPRSCRDVFFYREKKFRKSARKKSVVMIGNEGLRIKMICDIYDILQYPQTLQCKSLLSLKFASYLSLDVQSKKDQNFPNYFVKILVIFKI